MNILKRVIVVATITTIFTFPVTAEASGWILLLQQFIKMYNLDLHTDKINTDQLGKLNDLKKSLTGTHRYGGRNYDRYAYAWGDRTGDWQQILSLSRSGNSNGEVASRMVELAKEFPIRNSLNSTNNVENDYYTLQAQTALSSRSTSEVAYRQAVREEKTLRELHDMIDSAADEKSASDLSNRVATEHAMTSVQQTKLLSILVQQAAVNAQEKANRAREDMEFYDIK
tara:strand:+ start:3309 stop:3989 length:681 start_codon:yes stop_codon:yes gene_type:complete